MNETIHKCDEDLGYLLDEIDKSIKLRNNLHLIITSDHGIEQVNGTEKPMYLDDYVDMNQLKAFGTETVLNLFLQPCKNFVTMKKQSISELLVWLH